jgi:hypothetical protein
MEGLPSYKQFLLLFRSQNISALIGHNPVRNMEMLVEFYKPKMLV